MCVECAYVFASQLYVRLVNSNVLCSDVVNQTCRRVYAHIPRGTYIAQSDQIPHISGNWTGLKQLDRCSLGPE